MIDIDEVTSHYIVCMLWSAHDESDESGGQPFDENYAPNDLAGEFTCKCREDCAAFVERAGALLDASNYTGRLGDWGLAAQIGHDFWLTRNRHGAGFWDGDWRDGDELTEIAQSFGEVNPYVDSLGLING